MSTQTTFEQLTADVLPQTKDERKAAVAAAMGPNGELDKAAVESLTEYCGRGRSAILRLRNEVLEERPKVVEPEPENFIESLRRNGTSGFYFDELAMTMYRVLGCDARALRHVLADAGLPAPSDATMCRRLKDLSPRLRDGLRHGQRNRYRFQLTQRFETSAPYEQLQLDEFICDFEILVPLPRGGKAYDADGNEIDAVQPDGDGGRRYQIVKPRLLLLIESYSRFVIGHAVLFRPPTMLDTLALFADAFEIRPADNGTGVAIGGAPDEIATDNAGCFSGHLVEAFMEMAGSGLDIALGYSPQDKGKVENLGKNVQIEIARGLAGQRTHMQTRDGRDLLAVPGADLFRADEFVQHVAEVIHHRNYERVHQTTKQIPFDRLTEDGALGHPVQDDVLASGYLTEGMRGGGKRRVTKEGVKAFNGTTYQAMAFWDLIGSDVEIRRLHHRRDRVAVYELGGEFLTMAVRSDRWTEADERERLRRIADESHTINKVARNARQLLVATTRAADGVPGDVDLVTAAEEPEAEPVERRPSPVRRPVRRPGDAAPTRGRKAKTADTAAAGSDAGADPATVAALALARRMQTDSEGDGQ